MQKTTKHSVKSKGLATTAPHDHLQTHNFELASAHDSDPEVSNQAPRGPPAARVLLTPADIEVTYGIPRSTQAKMRMSGDTWPFAKRGRSVIAFPADIDAYLRSKLRRSTSDPGKGAA